MLQGSIERDPLHPLEYPKTSMNSKFSNRGAYLNHVQLQGILKVDATFQENIRALRPNGPNDTTFKQVRSWLVRSAINRYRRQQAEVQRHSNAAERLERELFAC